MQDLSLNFEFAFEVLVCAPIIPDTVSNINELILYSVVSFQLFNNFDFGIEVAAWVELRLDFQLGVILYS